LLRQRWLRVLAAALFAIAAVIQVPAMAIACATGAGHHAAARSDIMQGNHASHHAAQHEISERGIAAASGAEHHGLHSGHYPSPAEPADGISSEVAVCVAMSCCAVIAIWFNNRATADVLLGTLAIGRSPAMLAAVPDPADPPPRLRV
jgi:hypothetical protein